MHTTDTPIEVQEQAQLAEQKFRDDAIAQLAKNYIALEGISHPDQVTADHECEECGAPIPVKRVKALMAEFIVGDNSVWRANPNVRLCVDCATHNEDIAKRKRIASSGR